MPETGANRHAAEDLLVEQCLKPAKRSGIIEFKGEYGYEVFPLFESIKFSGAGAGVHPKAEALLKEFRMQPGG